MSTFRIRALLGIHIKLRICYAFEAFNMQRKKYLFSLLWLLFFLFPQFSCFLCCSCSRESIKICLIRMFLPMHAIAFQREKKSTKTPMKNTNVLFSFVFFFVLASTCSCFIAWRELLYYDARFFFHQPNTMPLKIIIVFAFFWRTYWGCEKWSSTPKNMAVLSFPRRIEVGF